MIWSLIWPFQGVKNYDPKLYLAVCFNNCLFNPDLQNQYKEYYPANVYWPQLLTRLRFILNSTIFPWSWSYLLFCEVSTDLRAIYHSKARQEISTIFLTRHKIQCFGILPDLPFVVLFSNFRVVFKIRRNSLACKEKKRNRELWN